MNRMSKLVLAILLGVIAGGYLVPRLDAWWRPVPSAEPRPVETRAELPAAEQTTIETFKRTAPSVVFITTTTEVQGGFFERNRKVTAGQGSGFIWDEEGHIVTNYHVLAQRGVTGVKVQLADQSVYEAEYVGGSADHDLAVLHIRAATDKLQPVPVGTSGDLEVGQSVLAIGNPFGWDQTLTTGVISALGRSIKGPRGRLIEGVIQTDAAINPGNSGGPLLDSAGRLIGVNTSIYSPTGANTGIGFSIPVDTVNRVVPQLISKGEVARLVLGVKVQTLGRDAARQLGVAGVMIREVTEGLGAAQAGLRGESWDEDGSFIPGDILQEVDGTRIRTVDDLYPILDRHRPNDAVEVKAVRNGRTRTFEVTLKLADGS